MWCFVEINSELKYGFSTGGNIVELNVFQDPPHRDWYNAWHSLLMHGRLLVSWNIYKKNISNFSCMFLNPNIFFESEF